MWSPHFLWDSDSGFLKFRTRLRPWARIQAPGTPHPCWRSHEPLTHKEIDTSDVCILVHVKDEAIDTVVSATVGRSSTENVFPP